MRNSIILSASIFIFASCSGNSEETTTPNSDTTKTDTVIATTIAYDLEWEAFKKSVVDNDSIAFLPFVGTEVSDPISLLGMLQEDWVMAKLSTATYTDLIISDYNGTPVKEFSVGVESTDEEGNTYESGIYLYFEETPTAFILVNVLMAG